MLDRESTFADEKIVALLREKFIPVAIDQWYTRRQKDSEGDFYRKIAGQGPRNDFNKTTQGLYIADASGKLIAYNNNRGPERIRKLMEDATANFSAPVTEPLKESSIDDRYNPDVPEGAAVIRSAARITDGYEKTDDPWQQIFQRAVSRDNLWILKGELQALARDEVPVALAQRIARFHFTDSTRGQPSSWALIEIRKIDFSLRDGKLSGEFTIESEDGTRGFTGTLSGKLKFDSQVLKEFEMVAKGDYWGAGQYTLTPPSGKFPIVIAFLLADGNDPSDSLPPHASRGWLDGYLYPER